ncbi:MAG TPA: inorganic phosphate transporter [Bryobacteraceae bacterium]|jgi:PiT family inorganic phosphate transporter|nr:inorganic phosphate transporter [Bryobacteraceae bacterium]
MSVFELAVLIIATALVFDYINGFHDAANSIATIVATRVLTPLQAVLWAAFFNFAAAFIFGTAVARTVGRGFVDLSLVTPQVILCGIAGAIFWDLLTWWVGLPTSSSHALIGGYAGAAVARAGVVHGWMHSFDALRVPGGGEWPLTIAFIFLAPLIGMVAAYILMVLVYWIFQGTSPAKMDVYFRKLQLVSAASFSLSHGSNDAQKTAGLITGVLFTSHLIPTFDVPKWVLLASYTAIAMGTLSGGWRIVRTMGARLTRLKPRSGFCAETGAAGAVLLATHLGLPVSTTHAIAGAVVGVGSINRLKAVRWGIATNIVGAWVLTIPMAAIIAWLSFWALHLAGGAS